MGEEHFAGSLAPSCPWTDTARFVSMAPMSDQPEPKSRLEKAVELAKAGAPAVARKLEDVAGVTFFREVLADVFEKSRQLNVEEFFRLLAQHAGEEETAALLITVTEGANRPEIYAAVAEGFENMRRCLDERARHVVAVLLAQELHDSGMPTEYFRSSSRLVADEPVDVLEAVRAMFETWLEVSTPDATEPILCRGTASAGPYWYTRTRTRDPEYVKSVRPDMREWFRFSKVFHLRFDSIRAISALVRIGYGLRTEGQHQEFGPGGAVGAVRHFEWDPGRIEWARHFVRALRAIPS